MTLTPGSRLGPYEIISPIGAGGMGEVFRAHDTRLERSVAIKVLPVTLSHVPRAVRAGSVDDLAAQSRTSVKLMTSEGRGGEGQQPITVVLNWPAGVQKVQTQPNP